MKDDGPSAQRTNSENKPVSGPVPTFPPMRISLAKGNEPFTGSKRPTESTLSDFWKWAYSDCLNNTTRGVLAEFVVALALELPLGKPREAWAKYDLEYQGFGIEIKSAAYHQVWAHKKLSNIQYNIPKTRAWDATTSLLDEASKRQAHVYVLCLLAERARSKVDPLNLDQWRFWVIPTRFFNSRTRSQSSITYNSLIREVGEPIDFNEVKGAVDTLASTGQLTNQTSKEAEPNAPPRLLS